MNPEGNNPTEPYRGNGEADVTIDQGIPTNTVNIGAGAQTINFAFYLQYDLQEVPFISPLLFDGTNGLYRLS